MKQHVLNILLVAGSLLASCQKAAPDLARTLTADEQPLVGTWRATKWVRSGRDSTAYGADPPVLTFQPTGFYQYSEGAWNNRNGFIWTTGQEQPGLFGYVPGALTFTQLDTYANQPRRFTATYRLAWLTPTSTTMRLRLADSGGYLEMTFVK